MGWAVETITTWTWYVGALWDIMRAINEVGTMILDTTGGYMYWML